MLGRREPSIPDTLVDQLLSGADPKTAFDPGGLLDGLKKALAERALNAEMDHHLAGENGAGNGRNGYGRKWAMAKAQFAILYGERFTRAMA
jgi:putative transposase